MTKKNFGVVGNFGGKLLVRVLYSDSTVFSKALYYMRNHGIQHSFRSTYKGNTEVEYAATQEQMLFITSFAIEGRIDKLKRLADARKNGQFNIPF